MAQEFAQRAVQLDSASNYEEAMNNYLRAAETLLELVKFTRNSRLKTTYESRAQSYIDRAKELKQILRRPQKASGSRGGGGDDDELSDTISSAIVTEKPDLTLDDVAGLVDAKRALREAIILPLMRPDFFTGSRRPWKGILLHGPPGCGKTMIAKATAASVEATFFNISAAQIMSKWLGESEKLVLELFEMAKKKQPSIIFIDEVDSLTQARGGGEHDAMRRVKTQLLTTMDGMTSSNEDRVVVIGATNLPWEIDSAFLRRFERRIYVGLPDYDARNKVFEINSSGVELSDDVKYDLLSDLTEGYSGSDIANLCREALMIPIRDLDSSGNILDESIKVRAVTQNDYIYALNRVKPTVVEKRLVKYSDWDEEFSAG
jgi:vacuolar protein-sorting-associated protein 4